MRKVNFFFYQKDKSMKISKRRKFERVQIEEKECGDY